MTKPAATKSLANALKAAGVENVSRSEYTRMLPEDVIVIGVDEGDENHPYYLPSVNDYETRHALKEDIRAHGVHEAITVQKDGINEAGKPRLLVVDGRDRVLSARELNRERPNTPITIKIVVEDGDPLDLVLLSARLNHHRKTDTMLTRAHMMSTAKRLGASNERMREALGGCSQATLDRVFAYKNLASEVRNAIDAGRIPLANIDDFALLPRSEQPTKLAAVLAAGVTKVHEFRDALDDVKKGKPPRPVAEMKRTWNRAKMQALAETLIEGFPNSNKEVLMGIALAKLFLGDSTWLRESPFDHIKTAVKKVDKDGEKRRARRKVNAEKADKPEKKETKKK